MRRLLPICLVLWLVWVGLAMAAPVREQSIISLGTSGEDSRAVALTSNTQGNTLLVAWCAIYQASGFDAANAAFSDTQGNTWAVAVNQGIDDGSSNLHRIYIAYAISTTAAANTVTCNPPGGSASIALVAAEYTGIVLTSPLDQTASNADAVGSTAVTTGTTGTTVQASELLVAGMVFEGTTTTITETSPLVLVQEAEDSGGTTMNIGAGDRILTSVGTYSAAWTLGASRPWAVGVATFKASATRKGLVIIIQ